MQWHSAGHGSRSPFQSALEKVSVKSGLIERRFIRHPSHMPISFELQGGAQRYCDRLRNISEGGLCFASAMVLDPGAVIRLSIPLFAQQFEVDATVAWCQPVASGHLVGVQFISPQERVCVRIVEQLCYIEDYRLQVGREEGRELDSEQAAEEWIERFSAQFPPLL